MVRLKLAQSVLDFVWIYIICRDAHKNGRLLWTPCEATATIKPSNLLCAKNEISMENAISLVRKGSLMLNYYLEQCLLVKLSP